MILSFLILTLAVVALVFEFLPHHLVAFLDLSLPCRAAFAFVVSPFFAGGFPAFESLCHELYIYVTFYILARELGDRKRENHTTIVSTG
jgi:hypothetical protein